MNQEAQFALRFVVKDLGKMRKAVEQMNQNLARMQNNANKASKGIDRVNSSMSKAARSVMKFALAYFAVSKVINRVFAKANEAIQLKLMATQAGVAREQIAKLGKALKRYGGDAKSAGSAYASLTDIIGGAQHGEGISEDVQRVNARYGIGFNYGAITQDQLITEIATAMQKQKNRGDQWAVNKIASAYGIDAAMAALLSEHGANWSKVVSAEQVALPAESETKQLIKAQEDLKNTLDALMLNFQPLIQAGVDVLNAILPPLNVIANSLLSKKWWEKQGEKVGSALYTKPKYHQVTTEDKRNYAQQQMMAGKISYDKYLELLHIYDQQDLEARGFTQNTLKTENTLRNTAQPQEFAGNLEMTIVNASGTPLKVTKTKVGGGLNTVSVNGL